MRNNENKTETILNLTNKKGCDLIFDCVGASEFENVKKNVLYFLNIKLRILIVLLWIVDGFNME